MAAKKAAEAKFGPFALKVYLIFGPSALKVSLLLAALKALKVSLLRNPYPHPMRQGQPRLVEPLQPLG